MAQYDFPENMPRVLMWVQECMVVLGSLGGQSHWQKY